MGIQLVVDSSADLPKEIIEKYQIKVVPLFIHFNEEEYKDGEDLTPSEFYKLLKEREDMPKTSQVTPEQFGKVFEESLKEKKEILCITIGSNASGTCQSAHLAKEAMKENERIHIIDSNGLSMGTGYLVVLAAKRIEEGKKLEEIIEELKKLAMNHIEHLFSVDTLEYLKKGGRIRASKALVADVLNIKPILNVTDALTATIGKVRGRKKIIPYFLEHMKENIDFEKNEFLSIAHSEDWVFAEELKKAIEETFHWEKPIYVSEIGATVGTHAGPGVIGVFYIKK